MKHYQILPHTADIRLRVEGSTLKELFQAAHEGVINILKPRHSGPASRFLPMREVLSLSAPDETALLIDFLNEVLYRVHVKKVLYNKVDIKEISTTHLTAELTGYRVESFSKDIKAVTYHEAQIRKNEQGNFVTAIVLDV